MTDPTILGKILLTVTDQGTFADTEYTFEQMMLELDRAKVQFLLDTFQPPLEDPS